MSAAAKAYWRGLSGRAPTRDEALAALDEMAETWRGADAEFDDDLLCADASPLAQLVAIAFGATAAEIADADDGEAWYEGSYTRFRKRYRFC